MTDIEDQIRATLRNQPDPRDSDEVLTRIQTRVRDRKRNRVAGALVVAAATVIAVSIPTANVLQEQDQPARPAHHGTYRPASHSIPWSNSVATVEGARRQWLAPQHTIAKWPPCYGDQLTAAPSGMPREFMGKTTYLLQVTNTSTRSCTLSGHPSQLIGKRPYGARAPLHAPPIGFVTDAYVAPANVRPGHSAWFGIVTGNGCPAEANGTGDSYRALQFSVGRGRPVTATWPGRQTVDLGCGAWLTPFGTLRPQHPDHVRIDALTAHASLPATVQAGSPVSYQVTLTNPTDHDIALDDPCPAYIQYLVEPGTSPGPVTSAYLLDCSAAPAVSAHSALTFDMRIPAPPTTGTATLGWAIPGTSLRASATVTVTTAIHAPGHQPESSGDGAGGRQG